MRFREYPLLNTPSMVLIVLRRGLEPPATLADCAAELRALLDRAGEHPPFGPADMASRLEMLLRYLGEAGLVAPAGDGGFGTTERGRAALAAHPQGFDTADLMVYPAFARYIRGLERRRGGMDPRAGGYDQGFYAYWSGEMPADNPYPPDSADHLAWENGWSEALDEDFRWTGPRASENLR
jgi:hypothetical protein